jgi:hypothetical protein
MPANSQSGNDIYFDPNGHLETDAPIFTLPRPQWLDQDDDDRSKENMGDSYHGLSARLAALRADDESPRPFRPDLLADHDGPPPRPLSSLSRANGGDPVLSDLSESEFESRRPGTQSSQNIGTQSSQESQDTFSGIVGGKKTKTNKKSKKKTRKHRRILNQVKKLLKEI